MLEEIKLFSCLPGTHIADAIREAIAVAQKNKCTVRLEFNERTVDISRFSTIEDRVMFWNKKNK